MDKVHGLTRVGICGGGPGGCTLALALGKLGSFQVTVLEKQPDLDGGFKIDFRGSAIEALKRLKVYEILRTTRTQFKSAKISTNSGSTRMEADVSGSRSGDDLEVMRGIFSQAVCEAAKRTGRVEFKFGQIIKSISDNADGVHVKLANGEEHQFDILVGADGLNSQVRKLVFEQPLEQLHQDGSRFNGFKHRLGVSICYVQTGKMLLPDGEEEVEFFSFGRYINAFNILGRGTVVAFAFPSDAAGESGPRDKEEVKKLLVEKFGASGISWPMMPRILDAIKTAPNENFNFSEATQVRMPNWSKGRVVLIGDAAACPSPLTGQGGSIAVLSGYIIARELFKAKGDYARAFPAYEQALREFVEKNHNLAEVNIQIIKDDHSFKAKAIGFALNKMPAWLVFYIKAFLSARVGNAAKAIELGDNLPFQDGDACD